MSRSPYAGAALRRSGLHFLTGKLATATLTFATLLLLVRWLPTRDYAVYVTLVAWLEITVAVAGIGLPWMGARYVPEFRLHAGGSALQALCRRMLLWLVMAIAAGALAGAVAMPLYLQSANLAAYAGAALLYAFVLFADGLNRLVIASLLDPLMAQQLVRRALLLRQGLMLLVVAVAAALGPVTLWHVVLADLLAATLAVGVTVVGLMRHLRGLMDLPATPGWTPPGSAAMWSTSRNMYGAYLVTVLYSPQVLLIVVTRFLGAEAAAVFGFLRALYDQVARYLPAMLLFNLIRPKLIASYVDQGSSTELNRNANLAGKLSLFVLAPLVAGVAATGGGLAAWLSGGRLPDTGHLLLGFMLVLVPLSQRQLLESVAVAVGQARLCVLAALAGLLTLPALWLLMRTGIGLWAAVLAIGLGQLLFNAVLALGLRRHAGYRLDARGAAKLAVAAAAGAAAGLVPHQFVSASLIALAVSLIVAVVVYLLVGWIIKPFSGDERARVNGLLRRNLFVW